MVAVLSKRASAELVKVYKYIYNNSPQNAAKVRDEIIDVTINLPKHPEFYPPDKFKKNNDGSWRAFELHKYRISYRVTKTEIRIVRVRHTSRSPKGY
ncbi:type II toxin-antitoxin system RelE/ParE family toxin [Agriterribacter sp.]|uniref:type II toxin-antitoxin system RelE/ParE family toxin n=1 Tax=Agriterribacter sp. TaxID=2821509 RepID=UPI002D02CC5C|nr:type II toxin-antitoxin system RelE/ParE family toxin [Agriterribacter sp.]HRP57499.1 type II toxin-antitoxin system RelE/ParE family toxin [Agriterribacter sp.]